MSLIEVVARALAAPLGVANATLEPADAIVVLGNPVRADGTLSPIGEERVLAAVRLFEAGAGPRVLFTGRGEAQPMAARAIELGLPEDAAMIEDVSRTTYENAHFAAAMLPARRRVWVVSQPFHMRRACFIFRRAGFDPLPYALANGVQEREPRLALKWSLREYVAWAKASFDALRD